jgi:hypothetical protein
MDLSLSTITRTKSSIYANGIDTSIVTVQLKDSKGNNVTSGGEAVVILTTSGNISPVPATDNSDGTYTANLTSLQVGDTTLSFTVNGESASATVGVKFIKDDREGPIIITDKTSIQSPNFYLQTAGSTGQDSSKGIHLRWVFAGALGDKHLPKGDYAGNNHNFNKPDGDFVEVYRSLYSKHQFTLDLSQAPQTVNDAQKFWLYKFNNDTRIFYVYFRNSIRYNQVRANTSPFLNPTQFIEEYGDEIIEIENKRELFFASEITVQNNASSSELKTEMLSVKENIVFTPKILGYRKTFKDSELNNVRLVSENGRSIRFRTSNCVVAKIDFEFYSDYIQAQNSAGGWQSMGEYALTLKDSVAQNMLEPQENSVNGNWLRYNDDAYVKSSNYIQKWNAPVDKPWERNIKQVVQNYISLSDELDNPRALETLDINLANSGNEIITIDQSEPDEGQTQVSNLDMLRIASYDYHVARMLGLGILDLDSSVFTGEYVYIAKYVTFGDLEDGEGAREVHHLSMSIPTSISDQRLPTPVDLSQLLPGLPSNNDETSEGNPLTDENGYSFDGKKRYVSIYNEELEGNQFNPTFYYESNDVDSSENTSPIYAGLEYRLVEPGAVDNMVWHKPELSHDKDYLNIDATSLESFEVLPIPIPENEQALFVHQQTKSGKYFYEAYGINIFSRSFRSNIQLDIETQIKPNNFLLPPSNTNALLVRNESPLLFSSQQEQDLLSSIQNEDKTLIRLSFDYHANQELINYQIPLETSLNDEDYLTDTETLYPDEDEVFADEVEIFFRNSTPKIITAKVIGQPDDHPSNQLLSVISTGDYFQASTGETLVSEFPAGTDASHFIGSLFLVDNESYIIHQISETADGLEFTVYKKEVSNGIVMNSIPTINSQNLQSPQVSGDGYFTVVENMQNQSNWGDSTNPHSLKVKIGEVDISVSPNVSTWPIHRELVTLTKNDGNIYKYIEKTRGIWSDAEILPVFESFQFQKEDGSVIDVENQHRGLYKIIFNDYKLEQHSQFSNNNVSVEWFGGVVRLYTESIINGGQLTDSRKEFNVFRIEEIGTQNNLVIYINHPNFEMNDDGTPSDTNDFILTGNSVEVNYYPGYKVYLYHSANHGLTENIILPDEGEGLRNSIFGLRSVDNDNTLPNGDLYKSKFTPPFVMFAQERISPETPEKPKGALYATRPDFFGRSTYTITTKYQHKPHSVLFYRADNQAFLNALYSNSTIKTIKESLELLGGNEEEYFTNRWENFLDFTTLCSEGSYASYPPIVDVYNITLHIDDQSYNFPCSKDQTIYEGAMDFNSNIPLSPPQNGGNNNSCIALLLSGKVDQDNQSFLSEGQMGNGFFLYDLALPRADVEFRIAVSDITNSQPEDGVDARTPIYFEFPLPDRDKFFQSVNYFITEHNSYYNNLLDGNYEEIELISSEDFGNLMLNHTIITSVSEQNEELKLIDFVKKAIENSFVPLTELPVIYKYINDDINYIPVNEKQNTRDKDGYLLNPNESPDFKMAPMMKIIGDDPHETYFTDFNLDGASNNIYFYSAKELGSLMEMSPFSEFLGPIKLVNTYPPEAPKIKKIIPVLENQNLGIESSVKFEINSYPRIYNIKKINLYRTFNRINAESVQSMTLVKTLEVGEDSEQVWAFRDDFTDLNEVPYGEQMFYRVTVSREVKYAKANYNPDIEDNDIIETDYAPSKPSKLIATMVSEVANPPAPILNYTAGDVSADGNELPNVNLNWDKTCYKGKYHVYKMNNQGNWVKIHQLSSNQNTIQLALVDTDLSDGTLIIKTVENNPKYHHFKVIAENTSAMLNTEENILTIPQSTNIVAGIGSMVMEESFQVG